MTPTKVLLGQGCLVVSIVGGGLWASTQWTAAMLGNQPRLGAPLTTILGQPIYAPWRLFEWWYAYEAYAPDVFRTAGMLAGGSGLAGTVVAIAGSLWRARQTKNVTTYGSARWAKYEDQKRAKLFAGHGVFLGKLGDIYLRHDGPEHVLAFAPTRSGKGVGLVIPTLLTWPHSTVIHDIKGENWQLTAGFRSQFSHCLLFNPADPKPASIRDVVCDAAGMIEGVTFPSAQPRVMHAERTFWEKVTAMHVFCLQERLRGDRFARHWHDVARLDDAGLAAAAFADRALANAVAQHKGMFFVEKAADRSAIDYIAAVSGGLQLVPGGEALKALEEDYGRMVEDRLLLDDAEPFEALMVRCNEIATRANYAAK